MRARCARAAVDSTFEVVRELRGDTERAGREAAYEALARRGVVEVRQHQLGWVLHRRGSRHPGIPRRLPRRGAGVWSRGPDTDRRREDDDGCGAEQSGPRRACRNNPASDHGELLAPLDDARTTSSSACAVTTTAAAYAVDAGIATRHPLVRAAAYPRGIQRVSDLTFIAPSRATTRMWIQTGTRVAPRETDGDAGRWDRR